jgi:hypothetical protein
MLHSPCTFVTSTKCRYFIVRLSISLDAVQVFLEFAQKNFEQKNLKNTRAAFREMDSLFIIHKNIKNSLKKLRFCHARHVIGALTLYIDVSYNNYMLNNQQKYQKSRITSRNTLKSNVFVTHVTKLLRVKSQKLISSSHFNY